MIQGWTGSQNHNICIARRTLNTASNYNIPSQQGVGHSDVIVIATNQEMRLQRDDSRTALCSLLSHRNRS